MNTFEEIHKFTQKWEGGYVNHAQDPGAATKYGISLRWLKAEGLDIDNDGDINVQDIIKLSQAKASQLYHDFFWKKAKCNLLPKTLATILYDGAVNLGIVRSTKILQRACNIIGEAELEYFTPLEEDGRIGKKTLEFIEQLSFYDLLNQTAYCALRERERFYKSLASSRTEFQTFLKGWLNRVADLRLFIGKQN